MAWNEPGPGRDPWSQGPGGNKRGDGPPDLDELLKRLKARFGGARPPRSGGGVPASMVWLVVVLVALMWLASGFYVIDEQQRGVVLKFGAYSRTTAPGWGWRMPWPLESVEVVNVTQVRQISDQASMLTKDENIVDIQLTVQYRVSSAEDYLFNVEDPDQTLRQATKSAVRETVGRSEMDFILTEGRESIADWTKVLLQERLDRYNSGLVVTEVNLQQAQPPQQVQAAFADAIKAREDLQRSKNEAEAYANDRLPRARGQAARQLEEAAAYRDQVVARAEGDAARFTQLLTEYHKSPLVTRERLYLDAMSRVLSNSGKVLVDVDKGNPVFYLPLDQLTKGAGRSDASGDYVTSPGASRPSMGSSDSSRARDRERP